MGLCVSKPAVLIVREGEGFSRTTITNPTRENVRQAAQAKKELNKLLPRIGTNFKEFNEDYIFEIERHVINPK